MFQYININAIESNQQGTINKAISNRSGRVGGYVPPSLIVALLLITTLYLFGRLPYLYCNIIKKTISKVCM